MSPFAIFAIVLTIGYIFYFGIVIAHDLYGKKSQENTNEEHFDVSSMQDTEESTQVDEYGDSFRIGNELMSDNSPNTTINQTDNNQTLSNTSVEEKPGESKVAKIIAHLEENMEETMPSCTYAMDTVKKKLMQYGAVRFTQENGKEVWKPKARTPMVGMKVEDMVAQYDLEIRGFYNYYCIANNVSATCADFGYIMTYSLYMTVAQKLNSSVRQILFRFKKDKVFTVTYKDDKGNERCRTLYNGGFKRRVPSKNEIYDRQPCTMYVPKATLAERLRANVCEICGKEAPLIMHHVRTLKTISSSTPWGRLMLNRHRKTVAVCAECFAKIENEE